MVPFHPGTRLATKNYCCSINPLSLWSNTLHWHYIWISCSYRLFNKNEGTDLYIIEHCELYTEIHGSIAVNSCQIELAQKDIILLSKVSIIVYKAGKRTGVENTKFISFNLLAGTYSIDDFNAKIKVAILQQRQDWEPPQIKNLRLDYIFIADNTTFIALGMQDKYLEKSTLIRSTLPPGSNKTSLDTSPPSISLSPHCKQISKVKNGLDGQSSSLLARMHVSNYKATFSPIHLVFLELDIDQPHLDFKILDENNNEVIPRTFYLQLLNKEWAYTTMKQQVKFIQI